MSNEVNLFLLGEIPEAYLGDRYAARTRTVAGQFAHMHNTRLRWLGHAAPALVPGLESFPRGAEPKRQHLKKALKGSEKAIASFLKESESRGKVPKWTGSPATFLGYLTAHEAHHRGLAMVAIRLAGHKLPQRVIFGQWQWGKRRDTRR